MALANNIHDTNKKLVHTTFIQRENQLRHHTYDDELRQYQPLIDGDVTKLEDNSSFFSSELTGHLSNNPLRNHQYLFVAATTLATRFSIESGLPSEVAYNISDLYIQEMDLCTSLKEVETLYLKMMKDFTERNAKEKSKTTYSKKTLICMDYIYYHLHESITVLELSKHVQLSPSTLSNRFIKETGVPISFYIRERRLEAAKNMLKFSDYSFLEIANYLAFSNHSHFISLFRKHTGLTPKAYRNKYFRHRGPSEEV